MISRRSPPWLCLGLLSALALGCRAKTDPAALGATGAGAPSALPSALPVDRALPDELAEGTEKAFGLPIPRVMQVRARFDDVVFGAAEVPPHRVANFVRQHVVADKVETGPMKTVFPRAIVRGQPGVELAIQVVSHGTFTELQVRNLSLVKPTPGLSQEERWRAAGLKPDGTLANPSHLH